MSVVLLLDDRIRNGQFSEKSDTESTLEGFAERLREREGFECFAPPMVDDRGFRLEDLSVEEMRDLLISHVRRSNAEAVVMDLDWWGNPMFGKELWIAAKEGGLSIPDRRLVFVTSMLDRDQRAGIVNELGLDRQQMCFKNKEGFDTAAAWLVRSLER